MLAAMAATPLQSSAQPQDSPKRHATSGPRTDQPSQRSQSPLRLDLTAALESPLVSDHIADDGTSVAALPGNVFLTLPIRYDRDAAPQTFSKAMIRGRDAKGFYGLRLLQVRGGRPRMEPPSPEPVYERIELKAADAAVHQILARNSAPPRRDDKDKSKQQHATPTTKTLPASGWMAIILEVPKNAQTVEFQWAGGDEEEVDLEFLKQAQAPLPDAARLEPSAPAVAVNLEKLDSPSSAMAALAILRLERLRQKMGAEVPGAWHAKVDAAVVKAGARRDPGVQDAAWDYLASYDRLPAATLRHIGEQKPAALRRWVELTKARLEEEGRPSLTTATQVLCGALRSDDAAACETALDLLFEWDSDVDWSLVQELSEKAQTLVLARVESGEDQERTERLLTILMKNVRPETAGEIAARAGRSGIRISSPVHPLLAKWRTMKTAEEKAGLLTILGALDLGDVIYSRPFADLVKEATGPKANKSLREAAFQLLIRQANRSCRRPAATSQPGKDEGVRPLDGGFPVLLSDESYDPFVEGVCCAAARGSRQTRIAALGALLLAGYPEEAERALDVGTEGQSDRSAVLAALFEQEAAGRSYGMAALMGRLLCKKHAGDCPAVLRHLERMAAKLPPAEHWQMTAAAKTGIRFDGFYSLALSLGPADSQSAMRWLCEFGHMTPQDRQRLAAGGEAEDRFTRLNRIDQRRAFLVDGRYGAIVILEILDSELIGTDARDGKSGADSAAVQPCRWRAPRHLTVVLPTLQIESGEQSNAYVVLWNTRWLGKGEIGESKEPGEPVRAPEAYRVNLVPPPESLLGTGGWGWTLGKPSGHDEPPPREYEQALGPAVLPVERTPYARDRGSMTLEIADYLRIGLKANPDFVPPAGDAIDFLPSTYEISLQYAAFGSFYGNGPQLAPPSNKPRPGQRHLMNVALILERIE
ncbi:MAG TPA: hypothetical protein VMV94_02495 [Phycisphaerae bacterium]|nr:hypothetical protein [Phycisphaerae bacterium]